MSNSYSIVIENVTDAPKVAFAMRYICSLIPLKAINAARKAQVIPVNLADLERELFPSISDYIFTYSDVEFLRSKVRGCATVTVAEEPPVVIPEPKPADVALEVADEIIALVRDKDLDMRMKAARVLENIFVSAV